MNILFVSIEYSRDLKYPKSDLFDAIGKPYFPLDFEKKDFGCICKNENNDDESALSCPVITIRGWHIRWYIFGCNIDLTS
jgi:hypothetical protein